MRIAEKVSLMIETIGPNKFCCVDLVVRLYDYLCVMSTIPTINPALTMQNINSKSKTTLASGFGSL